ncbi:hypothetical protein PCK1_002819 [Pneumocystis canis]|nr:hypothetical protein PCK1_002819 [Pneumocystis canis]
MNSLINDNTPPLPLFYPPPLPKEGVMNSCNSFLKMKKKEPLSIEELVKKKKEETVMNRPKFLTKEQREAIALEKRQPNIIKKYSFKNEGKDLFNIKETNKCHANMIKNIPTEPKAMRKEQDILSKQTVELFKSFVKKQESKIELTPEEKEIEDIRKRYLGTEDNKKKKRKTSERKFVFDWDNTEDTSSDINPIYSNRHSAQFLGRGKLGGFDDKSVKGYTESFINMLANSSNEEDRNRAKQLMDMEHKKNTRISWDDKHWSEKPLELMKERDWRIFKEDFSISSRGGSIPNPIRSWKESGLPKIILDMIQIVGYKEPSPIQRAAIPIGLQNRDIIGIAETGSGKTASFVLPMLVYISTLPPLDEYNKNDGPYAIILVPTRELAQQIETETKKFSEPMDFVCVSIVGGHKIEEQAFNIRDGVHIVIATPGRLLDCLERRVLVLSQCAYVVLDEADRMIDMGFEEAVNKLLDALPVRNQKPDNDDAENPVLMSKMIGGKERFRQTVMFSATMPPSVEKLAKKYLRRPAIVTIGNAGQAVDTVVQIVEMMNTEDKKRRRLEELLNSNDYSPPVIIFINQRRSCDALAKSLARIGWNAVTLHGGKSQEQRETALAQLRSGEADCLVATDLAGRGIDVADVSLVVNFNMAKNIEDYTHRIGRTGRAGKSGTAITFLTPEDTDVMYDLKQAISKSSISKVPDWLKMHEAAQRKQDKQPAKKTVDELLFQIPSGRWY